MQPYGERLPFDPTFKGPRSRENKEQTDFHYFIIFFCFFTLWCAVGLHGMTKYEKTIYLDDNTTIGIFRYNISPKHIFFPKRDSAELHHSRQGVEYLALFSITVLTGFGVWTYVYYLQKFAKRLVWLNLHFLWLSLLIVGLELLATLEQMKIEEKARDAWVYEISPTRAIREYLAVGSRDGSNKLYVPILWCLSSVTFAICYLLWNRVKISMICENIKENSTYLTQANLDVFESLIYIIDFTMKINLFCVTQYVQELTVKNFGDYLFWEIFFTILNLASFVWAYNFLSGVKKLLVSGVLSSWYWTHYKREFPILTTYSKCLQSIGCHVGTISLGALLIPYCTVLKILLGWATSLIRGVQGCIRYQLISTEPTRIERLIAATNSNLYVISAVHCTDLRTSATFAYNLVKRTESYTFLTPRMSKPYYWAGALYFTLIPTTFTSTLFHKNNPESEYIIEFMFILTGIMTFSMFDMLDTAHDTFFLCAMEDFERNNGSRQRPYYMTEKLKKLLFK